MRQLEVMWSGQFGNEYVERSPGNVDANVEFFKKALPQPYPESIIEFGAGCGNNLRAISILSPDTEFTAVEINEEALKKQPDFVEQYQVSMLDYKPNKIFELSMTKGVLIHIHPVDLNTAYQVLYDSSSRWILICEYFNPTPIALNYQGAEGRLWKRDFCSEMLEKFDDLRCVQYGFTHKMDGQDNLTFFLMEKQNGTV